MQTLIGTACEEELNIQFQEEKLASIHVGWQTHKYIAHLLLNSVEWNWLLSSSLFELKHRDNF